VSRGRRNVPSQGRAAGPRPLVPSDAPFGRRGLRPRPGRRPSPRPRRATCRKDFGCCCPGSRRTRRRRDARRGSSPPGPGEGCAIARGCRSLALAHRLAAEQPFPVTREGSIDALRFPGARRSLRPRSAAARGGRRFDRGRSRRATGSSCRGPRPSPVEAGGSRAARGPAPPIPGSSCRPIRRAGSGAGTCSPADATAPTPGPAARYRSRRPAAEPVRRGRTRAPVGSAGPAPSPGFGTSSCACGASPTTART
jgi:hypothetical protein